MACCTAGIKDDKSTIQWVLNIDGKTEYFRENPRNQITKMSAMFLNMYGHYKKGHLPFSGGIYNQPATYEQAMTIIGNEINSPDLEELEK